MQHETMASMFLNLLESLYVCQRERWVGVCAEYSLVAMTLCTHSRQRETGWSM